MGRNTHQVQNLLLQNALLFLKIMLLLAFALLSNYLNSLPKPFPVSVIFV